jgi:hypothetical protein
MYCRSSAIGLDGGIDSNRIKANLMMMDEESAGIGAWICKKWGYLSHVRHISRHSKR